MENALIAIFLICLLIGMVAYAARWDKLMYAMMAVVGTLILVFIIFLGLNARYVPVRLKKSQIVGEYRIDTTFYPGLNARWQYKHYYFRITEQDSMEFVVCNDLGIPRKFYTHPIHYYDHSPDKWRIEGDSLHHVIASQPVLYRGSYKFYYVFNSKKYGNMFFRKIRKGTVRW